MKSGGSGSSLNMLPIKTHAAKSVIVFREAHPTRVLGMLFGINYFSKRSGVGLLKPRHDHIVKPTNSHLRVGMSGYSSGAEEDLAFFPAEVVALPELDLAGGCIISSTLQSHCVHGSCLASI